MKTVITTLNAKYIHRSLAVRLLYVATRERGDVSFVEFSIKEQSDNMVESLLAGGTKVVAIGVYIWNVERVRELTSALKRTRPEVVIILGGPEVTYEPEYFLENWDIDYVVSGEGEFALGELLDAIEHGTDSSCITGVSSRGAISGSVAQADIEKVAGLPSPYMLDEDVADLGNRIIYFETSRGCPYQCQYCLSSLEKGVRYFPEENIKRDLSYLIDNGARQIKFLDRTFNLNKRHTAVIFDFLIKNHRPGLVCQFEIYADLMSADDIKYLNEHLPDGYFRFEIGIQSTHEPTNAAVKRHQNFEKLSKNIRAILAGGRIALHLDLIAGLPYETFELFGQSFDSVFEFRAKELQLGFLKMLRGTALRGEAAKHDYIYSPDAPYQIVSNGYISAAELDRIHDAEHALEKLWNSGRFVRTMSAVFETKYKGRYFEFFDKFGQYYNAENLPHHGYQLEDLFRYVERFLVLENMDLSEVLAQDYYSCFPICPRQSYLPPVDKKQKKALINSLCGDVDFLARHKLSAGTLKDHTAVYAIDGQSINLAVYDSAVTGPRFIKIK